LIPTTDNEIAYEYDSQEDPPKMDHPITRDEIVRIVMDVSEQDSLGSLSNIHLAYADKFGIKSDICTKLAGDISQEVDAAKTGKHPLTDIEISKLRKDLDNEWPDFMQHRYKRKVYPSKRILGKSSRLSNSLTMNFIINKFTCSCLVNIVVFKENCIVQHDVPRLAGIKQSTVMMDRIAPV
jgi:hypothetical protein